MYTIRNSLEHTAPIIVPCRKQQQQHVNTVRYDIQSVPTSTMLLFMAVWYDYSCTNDNNSASHCDTTNSAMWVYLYRTLQYNIIILFFPHYERTIVTSRSQQQQISLSYCWCRLYVKSIHFIT